MLFRPALANRHGLITGATGTGKTVTLQVLAENFSRLGVPVFLADVKGDLSGLAAAGSASPKLRERLKTTGIAEPAWAATPVVFWDVFGRRGFPVRATVSDLGPLLLGRLLGLNATQQGVLALVFKVADDNGLLLLDLKDLRAMLQFVGDNAREFTTQYGNVSAASIGAIQRALLEIEQQGGESFFGEPMLDVDDLLQTDPRGRGVVNILAAEELIRSPKLYGTFLLWLLSELFERLPEVGDPEKPTLVFFFDEAHLLFDDAPAALLEKIEQVVRLIRSKGVGVYFITQSPADVPDTVLGQLGNRVQHALRAFTPNDQKAVKIAADTLRPESEARHRARDHRAGGRRSARLGARREGQPDGHRARVDRAAGVADRPDRRRAARRDPQRAGGALRPLRADRRSRIGVREAEGEDGRRRREGQVGPAGRAGQVAPRRRRGRHRLGAIGAALRHPVRQHRTARRPSRRPRPVGREERGALGRLRDWPRDPARRARVDSRRLLSIAALKNRDRDRMVITGSQSGFVIDFLFGLCTVQTILCVDTA